MVENYLYAIVERLPPSWRAPATGIGPRAVQALRVGDLSVIATEVEAAPRQGPRLLSLHHDVVATTMDASAVLPLRCGTVLPRTEVDAWLRLHAAAVRASLARVRGRVEMNVRLLRLDWTLEPLSPPRARRCPDPVIGGAELRALAERLAERAGAPEWRFRIAGSGGNVAASVAFLLPRAEVADFLARIAPIAARATGVAVVPTGPWPAYSFVPALERGEGTAVSNGG